MCVMSKGKSIVPDVIGRIDSFGLCSNGELVDGLLRDTSAHFSREGFDGIHFLSIRQVMHAIDKWSAGSNGFCYCAVSEQHELLDELMCFVMRFEIDFYGIAIFIKSETDFVLFDSERSGCHSLGTQFLGKGIDGDDCLA